MNRYRECGFRFVLLIAFAFEAVLTTSAIAQDAREIMEKHDDVVRKSYKTYYSKMRLNTCQYTVKGNMPKCIEKARVSEFEVVRKIYDYRDVKSISIVYKPINDRGIGQLNYEYYDTSIDNDDWIYLPAFGKVKRIISTNEDSDDTGNFLGSEFSTEDMLIRKMDDYTYSLLGEETIDGRSAYIVEQVPTEKRLRKTKYSKIISWVDKQNYLFIKEDLYNHQGKLFKQRYWKNLNHIGDVWVYRIWIINNLFTRRISTANLFLIAYDVDVSDEYLTERSFTDFAFRERHLNKYRDKSQ